MTPNTYTGLGIIFDDAIATSDRLSIFPFLDHSSERKSTCP
ncbi:hypothetical protein [Nostoc sp.]